MQTTIRETMMEYINTSLHSNIKSNEENLLNYTNQQKLQPRVPGRQKKQWKRSSPTSERRTQHIEFDCNNRYEQLSHLPGDDNVDDNNDTIHTDRTNNTLSPKNGETSKLQNPKPPPKFIYGVTS
jgi:hypothetical protein